MLLQQRIAQLLPYTPNADQWQLVQELCEFVESLADREVFVLNGYAGTGKTSVIGALVKALSELNKKVIILAPTGRAAKVAGIMASHKSQTIHKRLFRGNSIDPDAPYFIAQNSDRDALFIVDEASLINDSRQNSLLALLVQHVYSAPGCKMILVGDLAQLPPVGQQSSMAMDPERLKQLGLISRQYTLSLPVRQASDSGILYNATLIRHALFNGVKVEDFQLVIEDFPDVVAVSSASLSDAISESYAEVGIEETIIISRSNFRANEFNRAVRNLVLGAEAPLQQSDRLIISKNDYYWSKICKLPTFVANGDVAVVQWVGKAEKYYGRYFCDVELYLPAEDITMSCKLMLRSLVTPGSSIPADEMKRFYDVVAAEKSGTITEKMKFVSEDPCYNALQAKYAYCVTCHKSQGGQWKHVYIDMSMIQRDNLNDDFWRWLYTAFTRATEKVVLINPGDFAPMLSDSPF